MICAEGYYSVGFRIQLNFKRILVQKILLSIGYFVGYQLFLQTNQWLLIYIVGYSIDLLYIFSHTLLLKEPWKKTDLLRKTLEKEFFLVVSSLIGGLATYIDRLIIYPIYGGVITSTYYAATLLGKGISLATFPIAGVLLSYFSKKKVISHSTIKYMTIFGWAAGAGGYGVCLLLSRPVLTYLYPNIVDEALLYVPVTLLSALIGVQNNIISPVVLKYCSTQWQIGISVISVLSYLIVTFYFLKLWGLMGFCAAGVVGALVKYLIY